MAKCQNYTFDGVFSLQVVIHAYSSLNRVGSSVGVDDTSEFPAKGNFGAFYAKNHQKSMFFGISF